MTKIIFMDIDGTIWDDRMQIPESTITAIDKLKENGHKAFICTGRARGNIRSQKLLDIGFDGIISACGNHVEMDGKIIFENILPPELVKYSINLLRECHMPAVLEGPEYHWIAEKGLEDDPYVTYLFQEMGQAALPLRDYTEDIRINKFSADIFPDTDYERIKRELSADFDILEHDRNVVEFVPKGTSKATGIQWLCNYLGADISDTYAIGDSVNDLDMLRFVGHGIAMGNGSQRAKDAAEYVTDSIHEDGVYHALLHYGLI